MKPSWRTRIRRSRWVLLLPGVLGLWCVIHTVAISWDGLTDEDTPADLAVVYGNTVLPPGRPSPRLQGRLDAAAELYRKSLVPVILVSGGIGREGFDEALVMRDALLEKGIPDAAILVDQQGYTTEATSREAARVLRDRGWNSAVAVSQFHHVSRAKLSLRKAGVAKVSGAHARYYELRDLYALLREFAAWYKYVLFSPRPRAEQSVAQE